MLTRTRIQFVFACLLSVLGVQLFAQDQNTGELMGQAEDKPVKVILVQLNPDMDYNVSNVYKPDFDAKKVRLNLPKRDLVADVNDIPIGTEVVEPLDCFYPSVKLIFRDYTYVLSTFCGTSIKLYNTAPFQPSSSRLSNEFVFTERTFNNLMELQEKHFDQAMMARYEQVAGLEMDELTKDRLKQMEQELEEDDKEYDIEEADLEKEVEDVDPDIEIDPEMKRKMEEEDPKRTLERLILKGDAE